MTSSVVAPDNFKRNLLISLGGHVLVLTFFTVRAVLVPSEPIEIRKAIRVDVVDLPQKMTEPQVLTPPPAKPETAPTPAPTPPKPEPVKETVKPAPPKPETVNLKKDAAKSQKSALDKIKAMAALDKIKEDLKKESAPPTVVRGNKVSEGNSLTGLDKIEYDRYFDDFESKIAGNWNLPPWLQDSGLTAQVQILIDERGYVTKKIMRRSSGNEVFDGAVMKAIEDSSPLPPPPARLAGLLSTSGIVLNFPK